MTQRLIPVLVILIALLFGWREIQQGNLAYRAKPGSKNGLVSPPTPTPAGPSTLMLDINVPAQVVVDHRAPSIVPGGRPFPLNLEPGTHSIGVKADGYLEQQFAVTLKPGETIARTIKLSAKRTNASGKPVEPWEFAQVLEKARDGAILELHAGDYRLANGLEIKASIRLLGAGRDKTRIVSDDENYVLKYSGQGTFSAQDLAFEHDGTRAADVVAIDSGVIQFERCRFSGGIRNTGKQATTGDGLWVRGTTRGSVIQSEFADNGLHGLEMQGRANLSIQSSSFTKNAEDGFVFFDHTTGVARDNTSRENGLHGVSVAEQADPRLENNNLERNKEVGLRYSGTASGTASGNTARRNGLSGLAVNDSARPTLEKNVLAENGSYGLYIAKDARPTLSDNVMTGNKSGNTQDLRSARAAP